MRPQKVINGMTLWTKGKPSSFGNVRISLILLHAASILSGSTHIHNSILLTLYLFSILFCNCHFVGNVYMFSPLSFLFKRCSLLVLIEMPCFPPVSNSKKTKHLYKHLAFSLWNFFSNCTTYL